MQQGIICILDILGTKGIWTEGSVDKYFKIINEIETTLLKPAKNLFALMVKGIPVELDFLSFSDTLVVTVYKTEKGDSLDDYLFHQTIEGFSQVISGIFQFYFSESFFLRGAISFGEMEKRGSHFVGPAVDDAGEYFELPDMIGVCFTPKTTFAMDYAIFWNQANLGNGIGKHVIKYKTPLKNKTEVPLYQIDWPKNLFKKEESQDILTAERKLSVFLHNRNIPVVALSKFSNSLDFFRHSLKNYR